MTPIEEKYMKFLEDLKLLSLKHRVIIMGTCLSEGITGEITLIDMDNPEECGWLPEVIHEQPDYKLDCEREPIFGKEGNRIGWGKVESYYF